MKYLLFLLFPISCYAFEVQPWFHDLFEFYATPEFTYRHYPNIDHANVDYSSNDQIAALSIGVAPLPSLDLQIEAAFTDTRRLSWGFQSTALQARYLLLDDVEGDPVSLTLNASARFVPRRVLHDPSTPYHSDWNYEVATAIGKEFSYIFNWTNRAYAYCGLGQANNGAPWITPKASFETNICDKHIIELLVDGYLGFGSRKTVHAKHFRSYASIRHRSVDLGAAYTYNFDIYGHIKLSGLYRIYARSYPEKATTITLSYFFPFSIF